MEMQSLRTSGLELQPLEIAHSHQLFGLFQDHELGTSTSLDSTIISQHNMVRRGVQSFETIERG